MLGFAMFSWPLAHAPEPVWVRRAFAVFLVLPAIRMPSNALS